MVILAHALSPMKLIIFGRFPNDQIMSRYVDNSSHDELSVQGTTTPIWSKSSLLTGSSKSCSGSDHVYRAELVSQAEISDVYDDLYDHFNNPSEVVLKVTDYTNMDKHYRKSVSFNKQGAHSKSPQVRNVSTQEQLHNGYSSFRNYSTNEKSSNFETYNSNASPDKYTKAYQSKPEELEWYTRPIHKRHVNLLNSDVSKYFESEMEKETGRKIKSRDIDFKTKEQNYAIDTSTTELAKKYFPVTLSTAFDVLKPFTSDRTEASNTDSDHYDRSSGAKASKSKNVRPSSGHSSSSSRSRTRRSRPSSAQSSSSSASKNSLDKLYLMAVETPVIGSSPVLLSSPYQSELAHLRMERLRIEEDHLLEVKRQDELERIRGPKPKWYELKDANFHHEAHKNNALLSSKDNWQNLLDYRTDLEEASKQFHNSYNGNDSSMMH